VPTLSLTIEVPWPKGKTIFSRLERDIHRAAIATGRTLQVQALGMWEQQLPVPGPGSEACAGICSPPAQLVALKWLRPVRGHPSQDGVHRDLLAPGPSPSSKTTWSAGCSTPSTSTTFPAQDGRGRLGVDRICELTEHGLVRPSFVPPKAIRILRDLTRCRTVVVKERGRESQRLHRVLEDAGIKLSSVVSKILTVSGQDMIEALVEGTRDPEVLAEMARGRMRAKIPQLKEALQGRFGEHNALVARGCWPGSTTPRRSSLSCRWRSAGLWPPGTPRWICS
jgi:hypothetical protein